MHYDDDKLLDCYHPPLEEMAYPLNYGLIQTHQFEDLQLQALRQQRPLDYPVMDMGNDISLICQVHPDEPWRIALPMVMVNDIIWW
jgi:hypothetical protein